MSQASFVSIIKENTQDSIMFCMPAHNGQLKLDATLDITELEFSDNLQNPAGIIAGLERKIAKVYNVDNTLIFTAGATSAIATALATAKMFGSTIAVDKRAHKSVYSYCKILGLDIIDIDNIDSCVNKLGAILVTSPDYFGAVYNCQNYKLLANKLNCLLIVDQSHGAHFIFSELLPQGQDSIADITINSLHKTMPVLTGGAIANVKQELYSAMVYNRAMLHTTSPSYLIMSSIDLAIEEFCANGQTYYKQMSLSIDNFKRRLSGDYKVLETADFSRLVVICNSNRADEISRFLAKNKVFIEMSTNDKLVFIITPYNHCYLDKVLRLLNNIVTDKTLLSPDFCKLPTTQTVQKSSLNCDLLSPLDAIGRVSYTDVGIYPPGIPIIKTNEVITKHVAKLICDNQDKCFGLIGKNIACKRR